MWRARRVCRLRCIADRAGHLRDSLKVSLCGSNTGAGSVRGHPFQVFSTQRCSWYLDKHPS